MVLNDFNNEGWKNTLLERMKNLILFSFFAKYMNFYQTKFIFKNIMCIFLQNIGDGVLLGDTTLLVVLDGFKNEG